MSGFRTKPDSRAGEIGQLRLAPSLLWRAISHHA
jgi:hypothetical protein